MMGLGEGISKISSYVGDWVSGTGRRKAPSVTTTPVRSSIQNYPPCVFCEIPLHHSKNPRLLTCKHPICQSCAEKKIYADVIRCPKCGDPTILDKNGIESLDSLQMEDQSHVSNSPDFEDVPLNLKISVEDMPFVDDPAETDDVDYTDATEEEFVIVGRSPTVAPNFYIPFTQRKESSKPLISRWLTNIWFPPSDLNEKKEIEDSQAYYVPFYVFSVKTQTHWTAEAGKTNEKKEVQWNEIEGNFSSQYEQLSICASSGFSSHPRLVDLLLNAQKGFSMNTDKVIPSDPPVYKPGMFNDNEEEVLKTDITHSEAFEQLGGSAQISKWEKKTAQKLMKEQHKPEQHRNFTTQTHILSRKHFIILLPIFKSGFSYGGKQFEVLISGNKGIVVGNRPFGTGVIGKVCMDAFNTVSTMVGESI